MKTILPFLFLIGISLPAAAQRSDGGSDMRWNVGGPAWYETQCGQMGFSVTHGLPYSGKWVKPCSIPVRVCEFKRLTVSYIADPDKPCEEMIKPMPDGGLVRTYIKRWD